MKIFITGANGQLAKSFLQIYPKKNLILATKEILDVTNRAKVFDVINKHNPDFIFHFASITRGDESAKNPKKAYKINFEGTKNIVDAIIKSKISLLFVSTNEVFDGINKNFYTEKDVPNPVTVIGKTKYEAENYIRKNLKNYYIVRTSWLYSKWGNNFIHSVLKKAKTGKQINLVTDEISSPTYTLDLADAIKKLIKTKKYGIYHLSNLGTASRLDFAKKTFEIIGLKNIKIKSIKLKNYPRASKPPLFTPLDNSKAKALGIVLPRWDISLKIFLKEI